MTKLEPNERVVVWACRDARERIQACAAMLNLHDFLTDSERAKVNRRIKAWLAKNDGKGGK